MPVTIHEADLARVKSAIKVQFKTLTAFERATGLAFNAMHDFAKGAVSAGRAAEIAEAIRASTGVMVAFEVNADRRLVPRTGMPRSAPSDPLAELHQAGRITRREVEAGRALRAVAADGDYPGRLPPSYVARLWPPALAACWRALAAADAETDSFRPRYPTASLVVWNVAVGRERIELDPRDNPLGRVAVDSLRIGLQHLEDAL
ncbi:hypothetical protein [Nitrospirillum amazonense]|uniref:hypothetical protein n=1 Tax=Nitrospirillum amazonense TaxID=28077 RepID=UPI0011A37CA8|nr:hypothetical protein [Nitrospirillum amazonense]